MKKNKLHNPQESGQGIRTGRRVKPVDLSGDIGECEKCGGNTGKFYFTENGFPTCKYLCINCDKNLIDEINKEEEERENRLYKSFNIIDKLDLK